MLNHSIHHDRGNTHGHGPLVQQREATVPRPVHYQGAIVVSGDDYEWNPQHSDPLIHRRHHVEENAHRVLHRTPMRANSRAAVTNTFANLSLAEGTNNLDLSQDDLGRASLRAEIMRNRRLEKDAAKTAATYYGECYLEGVGMNQANEAARESHEWYKKWKLREMSAEKRITSFGDAIGVPIYNTSPKSSPSLHRTSTRPMDIPIQLNVNVNEKGRQPSCNYYAIDESENKPVMLQDIGESTRLTSAAILHSPESHPDLELMHAARGLDRSSGACHPSPKQQRDTTTEYSSGERSSRSMKKRRRSVGAFSRSKVHAVTYSKASSCSSTDETIYRSNCPSHAPYYDESKSKAQTLTTARFQHATDNISGSDSNGYHGIDPYATTDDEVGGLVSIPMAQRQTNAFERTRYRRLEYQRRGSTSSDSEYEFGSLHVNTTRKGAQGKRTHALRRQARHRYGGKHDFNAIMTSSMMPPSEHIARHFDNAKLELLRTLAISGGDVTNKSFLFALEQLRALHGTDFDARFADSGEKHLEGNWLIISRPHYTECLGKNTNGEYLYTLGRMSFDLFGPGNLVCSISGIFNSIQVDSSDKYVRSVPKSLRDEVTKGNTILRKYDIVTAFKIEQDSPLFGPHSPNRNVHRPLRGTITTYGHVLPDPKKPNRLSIWFSGGKIEPSADQQDLGLWTKAFGGGQIKRQLQQKAKVLAAKLLLGATVPSAVEGDGSMEFVLTRPIGGHGSTYVDVLYLDDSLRIVQGNKGSIFVMTRVSS